ncbi:MAG TPA: hypothetical protein VN461_04960 [Vicinamibacteria bacterium]|jgi:hypothetical protein|nr:hypothetical protein [Vicinamibacteria bacterium]
MARLLVLSPLLAFVLAYAPDMGRGFIKDDFRWIAESRAEGVAEALALFGRDNGFYRPLVGLSFAADHALFGVRPFPYALTNLLVILAAAAVLYALARALGLSPGAAALAAGAFLLNPHGIKDAILWISGRTSGLLTLLSLLAAFAFVRGRVFWAAGGVLLALFCKEEAVLLPAILAAGALIRAPGGPSTRLRGALLSSWPLFLPLPLYFALRSMTSAFLPATAPPHYRLSLDPGLIARNVFEYTDRACTIPLVAVALIALAARSRPRVDAGERGVLLWSLLWIAGGYGLTLWLPVRSSLYAVLPSAGAALAGAALAQALWREAAPGPRTKLLVAAALVPLLMVPLFRDRNRRAVSEAELSTAALDDLARAFADHHPKATFVLEDDPQAQPNLERSFGTLLESAVFLRTGRVRLVRYFPAGTTWTVAEIAPYRATGERAVLALRGGRLREAE